MERKQIREQKRQRRGGGGGGKIESGRLVKKGKSSLSEKRKLSLEIVNEEFGQKLH